MSIEFDISEESQEELRHLKNTIVIKLNKIVYDELKRMKKGEPTLYELSFALYSIYIEFAATILDSVTSSVSKLDDLIINKNSVKEK